MRKVIGKQRLVKAIALSLAAIMTVAQPLTAFAESGDDYEEDSIFDENYTYDDFLDDCSEHITDDAQEAANKVVEFVEEPVIQDVVAVKLDVTGADDAFDEAVNEAINAIKGGDGVIDSLKDAEKLHTQVVIESQAVVIGVEAATAVAGEVVESVNTTIDEAKIKAENLQAEMNKATTEAEVQKVKDDFQELVDATEAEVDAAVEEYETVVGYYEAARKKVKELADEYDKAIDNASAKAEYAKEAMQEAQAKASELAKEVEIVRSELEAVASGALEIMELQKKAAGTEDIVWSVEDKLFEAILKNYYIPSTSVDATNIEINLVRGPKDGEDNYFKVTYKLKDGTEKTEYLNYLMQDRNLVIFEKREVEVNSIEILRSDIAENSASKIIAQHIQMNKNFSDGKYLFNEADDEGFAKYIKEAEDAIKLIEEYKNIVDKAAAADKELGEKLELVDKLSDALKQLKSHGTIGNDMAEVASDLGYDLSFLEGCSLKEAIKCLEERIAKASEEVEAARNRLGDLKLEVKVIEEEIDNTIVVGPSPVPPTGDVDDTTLPVVLPVVDPAIPVVVPQSTPIVATTTQVVTPVLNEDEATATIEDNQVPLAGEIVDEPEATVTIEDEEVPLAGSIPVDKTAHNWWWLLLLVVAAVGYYTYRRYKNRQAA